MQQIERCKRQRDPRDREIGRQRDMEKERCKRQRDARDSEMQETERCKRQRDRVTERCKRQRYRDTERCKRQRELSETDISRWLECQNGGKGPLDQIFLHQKMAKSPQKTTSYKWVENLT